VRSGKTAAAARHVHVPAGVASELADLEPAADGALFGHLPRRKIQDEHNRACSRAGIDDFRLHDLRHHYAVTMARAGMPLGTLQQQLGHETVAMTMKYASFAPSYSDVAPYSDAVATEYGYAS
jgi:integrase